MATMPPGLTGYAAEYWKNLQTYGNGGARDSIQKVTNMTYGNTGITGDEVKNIYAAGGLTAPQIQTDSQGYYVNPNSNPYSSLYTPVGNTAPNQPETYKPGDLPEGMSYAEALKRAQKSLNPQYDTARGRLEQQYSQLREQNPQIMAARYGGLSGIRGGRLKSAQATTTQREAQSIDENERSRITAVEQLAQGLQNEDYQRQMQAYQLAEQLKQAQYNAVYQQYRDALAQQESDKSRNQNLILTMLNQDYQKEQDSYARQYQEARDKISDTRYDTEWSASPQSQNWYLDLYKQGLQADIQNTLRSANAPYGGGGGLTASDIKAANQAFQAKEVAEQVYGGADPKNIEAQLLSPGVYSNLSQNGVDVYKLIDHAYIVKYGLTKSQYNAQMADEY
jgi:hypothetical protein